MTLTPSVVVLVLGDIGRSPRMMNHTMSLARNSVHVDLVGYSGVTPPTNLMQCKHITIHNLSHFAFKPPHKILYIPYVACKVFVQLCQLLALLLYTIPCPQTILVQNPPALPSLLVVHLVCWLRNCRLIIDWHNFGYSILAMKLQPNHPIVRLAYWYERIFGRGADGNFCVTKAMKNELQKNWSISATLLYDRPPLRYRRLTSSQKLKFFARVKQHADFTPFLEFSTRVDKPMVVVSSTSYTIDEDFGILLQALQKYDAMKNNLPPLVVIITGQGPLKHFYREKIKEISFNRVCILQVWLAAEDYPLLLGMNFFLLGAADLGVCLHTSSSGLDLPMKVVDMFGCGLPVCAINFQCLTELIEHDNNGLVFNSSTELTLQMKDLFTHPETLSRLAEGAAKFQKLRWHDAWMQHAAPMLTTTFAPVSKKRPFAIVSTFVFLSAILCYWILTYTFL